MKLQCVFHTESFLWAKITEYFAKKSTDFDKNVTLMRTDFTFFVLNENFSENFLAYPICANILEAFSLPSLIKPINNTNTDLLSRSNNLSFCPFRYHLNYNYVFSSLYSSVISLISRNSPKIMIATPVIQSNIFTVKKNEKYFTNRNITHNATSRVVEVLGLIMDWLITLFYMFMKRRTEGFYRRRFEITDKFFICFLWIYSLQVFFFFPTTKFLDILAFL